MQDTLEVQTNKFWCTARTVRHDYLYASEDIGNYTDEQKLYMIDYQIKNFTFKKTLLDKFGELRQEFLKEKENGFNQQTKITS